MNGGYEDGYKACDCFWGTEPGSYVRLLGRYVNGMDGWLVLDAGCGEGKNAVYFSRKGASVQAVDISSAAISNARKTYGDVEGISWNVADLRSSESLDGTYDAVVMYGLLHCLSSYSEILCLVSKLQCLTKLGGYHVVCSFNDRHQDLSAHPGFNPTLISHDSYLELYKGWKVLRVSDKDLTEEHPNNRIPHAHSMTRILAQKEQNE